MASTGIALAGPLAELAADLLAAFLRESDAAGGAIFSGTECLAAQAATTRGMNRDFPLSPTHRLLLIEAHTAPSTNALRFAGLALQHAVERETVRAKASRLEAAGAAMLGISRAICSVPVLDELLTLVAERCRELLGCEVAGFALLEEDTKTIVWRAMCGCRTETYRNVTYADRAGVAGRAISSNGPFMVRDFLSEPDLEPSEFTISFAEGLRSVLGVPLEIDKRARGCLMIGYRSVHEFPADEIDTLTSFSLQAAIAVENAELYDRLRRERARLESVVASINEGLVLVDRSERISYANRQARGLLRLAPGEPAGVSCRAFFESVAAKTADPESILRELIRLETSEAEFPACEIELCEATAVNLRLTRFKVFDEAGECLGSGYLCRDVTFERQVDAMKTDVISLVSHEIKTPLASIRGYASALLDESRTRDRALELDYLRSIDSESARLDDLVCNLTDVSKLDAGVLFLERHDISPAYLLRTVFARWVKSHPARRFEITCDEWMAPLHLDRRRIAQVLDNLLSNAVKYSPPDSVVSVALSEDRGSVTFVVADCGGGIPQAQRERVFERFYRVSGGRRGGEGSGLGLFISRGIVVAHGGEISLQPRDGGGTMVTIAFPRVSASVSPYAEAGRMG